MPSLSTALFRSSRPIVVTLATVAALALGLALALEPLRLVVLCLVVLTGQAATGMSLDWRPTSTTAAHAPTRSASPPLRLVRAWSLALTFASVALAILLGPWPTLVNAILLSWAWAYNLWLRGRVFSVVLYVVWFGLLPLMVTLSLAEPVFAPWWMIVTGAALGAAIHFARRALRRVAARRTGAQAAGYESPPTKSARPGSAGPQSRSTHDGTPPG